MEELKELNQILPFLIPIIIAEVILLVVTLRHILTHTTYKRGNRMMWQFSRLHSNWFLP